MIAVGKGYLCVSVSVVSTLYTLAIELLALLYWPLSTSSELAT